MISKVICGFPCIGKTYLFKHSDLKIADSDSSKFSWITDGEGKKVQHFLETILIISNLSWIDMTMY